MKKLMIVVVVAMLALVGCDYPKDRNGIPLAEDFTPNASFRIVEVNTRGEVHEYITFKSGYRGGITHLPNCKYCNKKD